MLVLVTYPEEQNQKSYTSRLLSKFGSKRVYLVECDEATVDRLKKYGAEVRKVEDNKKEHVQFFYDLFKKNAGCLKLEDTDLEKLEEIEEELQLD